MKPNKSYKKSKQLQSGFLRDFFKSLGVLTKNYELKAPSTHNKADPGTNAVEVAPTENEWADIILDPIRSTKLTVGIFSENLNRLKGILEDKDNRAKLAQWAAVVPHFYVKILALSNISAASAKKIIEDLLAKESASQKDFDTLFGQIKQKKPRYHAYVNTVVKYYEVIKKNQYRFQTPSAQPSAAEVDFKAMYAR